MKAIIVAVVILYALAASLLFAFCVCIKILGDQYTMIRKVQIESESHWKEVEDGLDLYCNESGEPVVFGEPVENGGPQDGKPP